MVPIGPDVSFSSWNCSPPTRGMGAECTLRGSGLSIIPSAGARRIISGISAMLVDMATITSSNMLSDALVNLVSLLFSP